MHANTITWILLIYFVCVVYTLYCMISAAFDICIGASRLNPLISVIGFSHLCEISHLCRFLMTFFVGLLFLYEICWKQLNNFYYNK